MSRKKSKQIIFRIGLIVLAISVLILAGMQLFLRFYLDSYVENRLTSAVSEQTEGQYELKMDELNLSVWGRKFEMENIRLHPSDTSSTAPKIDMRQFSINKIQFFPYLFRGDIHMGQVQLSGPTITFVQNSPDSLTFLESSSDSSSGNKKSQAIEIDQFLIENGALTYWNSDQSNQRGELHNFNLDISEVQVDSTSRSKARYFNFSNIQTSSGNIRYELNNDLYAIETNGFNISTNEGFVVIDSLKLIPQLAKYDFTEKIGHQKDRISLTIAGLRLENPDVDKLKAGQLDADYFTIENADLEIFHSKMMPPGPESEKTFPHVAFKNLPFPVTIDTITIHQADISYTEHLPDVFRPGTISFENTKATFTGVTNNSTLLSGEHTIVLDVTSEVMGEATLTAHFEFPMHLDGSHMMRGSLGSMTAATLNPILEPAGLVRAENGTIHSLQFLMDLDTDKSTGWTELIYSDLKIDVLNSRNVEDGGKNRLKSFLANIMKIKKDNNKEPFRRGEINFERSEKKSIFSYWWKSLATGLKDNAGI